MIDHGTQTQKSAAQERAQKTLRTIDDLGLGLTVLLADGTIQSVRKFMFHTKRDETVNWITKHRVLHSFFVTGKSSDILRL